MCIPLGLASCPWVVPLLVSCPTRRGPISLPLIRNYDLNNCAFKPQICWNDDNGSVTPDYLHAHVGMLNGKVDGWSNISPPSYV